MRKVKSIDEFYQLKKGKRSWTPENIELKETEYKLYSPYSDKWFDKKLEVYVNPKGETDTLMNLERLKKYIRDGNIYIK